MPFYLVATNFNLAPVLGAKLDTNVVSSSLISLVMQFVPWATLRDPGGPGGYIRVSGRYGVLVGRTLTLTDFDMDLSDANQTKDEVLSVRSRSLALQVPMEFAEEVEKLRSEAAKERGK
jgi:hypothetical protein